MLTSLSVRSNTALVSCPYCSISLWDRTNFPMTAFYGRWGPFHCADSNSTPCWDCRSRSVPLSSPRQRSRHFRACSPCSASRGTRRCPWHWPCRITPVQRAPAVYACCPAAVEDDSLYDGCWAIRRSTKASALSNCPDLRSPEARLRLPRLQQSCHSVLRAAQWRSGFIDIGAETLNACEQPLQAFLSYGSCGDLDWVFRRELSGWWIKKQIVGGKLKGGG